MRVGSTPTRPKISGGGHAKVNDLKVSVINLSPARLIGDEFLLKAGGVTETSIHNAGRFASAFQIDSQGKTQGPVAGIKCMNAPDLLRAIWTWSRCCQLENIVSKRDRNERAMRPCGARIPSALGNIFVDHFRHLFKLRRLADTASC